MICPRCTQHQPDATECGRCGLVIAKWNPDAAPRGRSAPPPPSAPAPPADSGGRWLSVVMGVLVVTLAGGGFFVYGMIKGAAAPPPIVEEDPGERARRELESMRAAAKELGCPRAIQPTEAIQADAAKDPLPAGWMLDAPGWSRVTGPDRSKDQPILVYFGVPWCKYASAFERDTLADTRVRERVAGFARVRINPSAGDTEARVADDFGVKVYPTVVLVRAGDVRSRIDVLRDVDTQIMLGKPEDFVAALDLLDPPKGEGP